MRRAFIQTLVRLAETDERIVLLTGDLGFTVVEPFADRFPKRYFNAGVAEQNMVGMATGMAETGLIPFVYSIATFATLRPYEFIRNGPVLHRLPIRIVGVGGGFDYGVAGFTHHGLEDLAVMRVLPGMSVISPADHMQTAAALRATWDLPGPVYYRLGKSDDAVAPGLDGSFEFGRIKQIRSGRDLAIVSTGAITLEAIGAADALATAGVKAAVFVAATVSPSPASDLVPVVKDVPIVATVEAHYRVGGLGSLVAEVMAESGSAARLIRFGVEGAPDGIIGSDTFLNRRHGLAADQIADRILGARRSAA